MGNKKAFSLSKPLMLEILKMYWYVPALSFAIYFLTGIFPLILSRGDYSDLRYFINHSLNNTNGFLYLIVLVPLVASLLLMGFMHKPVASMSIHAQPFSKSRIFNSHVLVGWLMCILPILLMTLCYLLFMQETYMNVYDLDGEITLHNIYTLAHVMEWMGSSLVMITFFWGVYTLAGALVGSFVMHILTSAFLLGSVPLVIYLVSTYCSEFFYGYYTMPTIISNIMYYWNPIISYICYGELLGGYVAIAYVVGALVLIALARLAYGKAALEHVGDSTLYPIVEDILTYFVAFVSMTLFGNFLYAFFEGKVSLYLGMLIGILLAFVVAKLIMQRTIKIFNRRFLTSLVIYIVFAAAFSAITVCDVLGYDSTVPSASQVQSVNGKNLIYNQPYADYSTYIDTYTLVVDLDDEFKTRELTSEDSIEHVLALHQYIVDNELYLYTSYNVGEQVDTGHGTFDVQGTAYIKFAYTLNNGSTMYRYFLIALDDTAIAMINDLISCDEYCETIGIVNILKAADLSSLSIDLWFELYDIDADETEALSALLYDNTPADEYMIMDGYEYYYFDTYITLTDQEKIEEFVAAYEQDLYNYVYTGDYYKDLDGILANHLGSDSVYGCCGIDVVAQVLSGKNSVDESIICDFPVPVSGKNVIALLVEIYEELREEAEATGNSATASEYENAARILNLLLED